jgi:CheY-like chemotaxis protein
MRILYLEDFEPDASFVRQYMGSTDHEFMDVRSIDEAAQILESAQPDVFLVDIVIGGDTSYELIKRAVDGQAAKHVVAVTAKALPGDQRRCLNLGCTSVITKPFTVDILEQMLDQLAETAS